MAPRVAPIRGVIAEGGRAKQAADAQTNRLIGKVGTSLGTATGELGRAGIFGDTPFTERVFGPSNEKVAAKEEAKEQQQEFRSAAQIAAQLDIPLETALEFAALDGPPSAEMLKSIDTHREDQKKKKLKDIEDETAARARGHTKEILEREKGKDKRNLGRKRALAEQIFRAAVADPNNDITEGVDDQIIAQIEANLASRVNPLAGIEGVKRKITIDDILDFRDKFPEEQRTLETFMSLTKGTTLEGNKELLEIFKAQTPRDKTAELAEEKFTEQKKVQAQELLTKSANEEIRQAKETLRMQRELDKGIRQAKLDAKNAGNERLEAALEKAKASANAAMEEMRQASTAWKAAVSNLRAIKRDVLNNTPEDIAVAEQEVTTALTELRIKQTLVNQAKDAVVAASGNTITIEDIDVQELPTGSGFLDAIKEALKDKDK